MVDVNQHEPGMTAHTNYNLDRNLRWSDLPLCECSLRHWPEEINERHVVSLVSGALTGAQVWVSGDAPKGQHRALVFTEHIAALGVRHIIDVRAEAAHGSSLELGVLDANHIVLQHLGVIDHNDAFADIEHTRAWAQALLEAPDEPTLVHCHMGVNRSASAAVLLLMARGVRADVAARAVLDGRPTALAIYAPAALRSLGLNADAELVREVILAERGGDRRLRDAGLR